MQNCHIILGKVLHKYLCKHVPLSIARWFRGRASANECSASQAGRALHSQVNKGIHDL